MADVESATQAPPMDAAINETDASAINGTTGKIPATPEGMALAYGSLLFMALVPIWFGSFRSVKSHKESRENSDKTGEKPETMTQKDAAMFPLVASCALFGLYVFFQILSKEHINLLLSVYFFVLGVLALTHITSPTFRKIVPESIVGKSSYHFEISSTNEKGEKEDYLSYDFKSADIVGLAASTCVGVWYLLTKHWMANDLFGLAFAVNGVELLHLNKVITGCILLGGLFFYDIFWVFGTDVMVTVAKSFEAPIKLVFPQDLFENGLKAENMAMLGLGDIVIPGIFVALMLRYDKSLNRNSTFYFYTTFIAYIAGLFITIAVMHLFKHAQPALLYLVPACLGSPIALALVRGDIKSMFSYADHPGLDDDTEKTKPEDKKKE